VPRDYGGNRLKNVHIPVVECDGDSALRLRSKGHYRERMGGTEAKDGGYMFLEFRGRHVVDVVDIAVNLVAHRVVGEHTKSRLRFASEKPWSS